MNIPPVQTPLQNYKATEKEVRSNDKAKSVKSAPGEGQIKDAKSQDVIVYKQNVDAGKKVTYDKPKGKAKLEDVQPESKAPDQATIDRLIEESEKAFSQLRDLVEKLLLKQGHTLERFLAGEVKAEDIEVDEQTRLEAERLIADDGPLGAEAVSDRIVDFAIAISGGDVSKFEMLRGAINAGFDEAKRMLGGQLPEVSMKTHKLVMEKLDRWVEEQK